MKILYLFSLFLTLVSAAVDTSSKGLGISAIISGGAFVVGFLIFIIARDLRKDFFAPKLSTSFRDGKTDEGMRFIGWIWNVWMYREADIFYKQVGMDGYMYLQFLRVSPPYHDAPNPTLDQYSMVLCMSMGILGLAIITPINYLGQTVGLDTISMANIQNGNRLLYVHYVSVFLFSAFVWFFIYKLFRSAVLCQIGVSKPDGILQRSVIVKDLPPDVSGSAKNIRKYFERMYGKTSVHNVLPVPRLDRLSEAQNERADAVKEKKRMEYRVRVGAEDGLVTIGGVFPFNRFPKNKENRLFGQRVNGLQYWKKKISDLNSKILELQKKENIRGSYTDHAFVCFRTVGISLSAQQSLMNINSSTSVVSRAPHPKNIHWTNLTIPYWQKMIRLFVCYGVLLGLFITWFIPVAIISLATRLDNIARLNASLAQTIENNPFLAGAINSFLPTLAFNVFILLLPHVIRYVLSFAGMFRFSNADKHLMIFYWLFLFFISFLGYLFTGSFVLVAQIFVTDPVGAINQLGSVIARQGAYFANYVILQGWAGSIIFGIARLDEFIIMMIKRRFFCVTEEEKKEADIPSVFSYGINYPRQLLVLLIAIVYSSMAPYVTALCFTYFLVSYFSAKYNMLYVVKPHVRESHLSKVVIHCTGMAVILYQLVMTSALVLKGLPAAISLISLVFASILISIYNHFKWSKAFLHMPMDQTDESESREVPTSVDTRRFTMLFHHPALTPPDREDEFFVSLSNSPSLTHTRYKGTKKAGTNPRSPPLDRPQEISVEVDSQRQRTLKGMKRSRYSQQRDEEEESIADEDFVYESASSDDELFAREEIQSELLRGESQIMDLMPAIPLTLRRIADSSDQV
ncbi:hypothetical protein PROFUN_01665 [Planoprotostelium fungivorum]|uniref:DUF221-domain-containing protein n=1 Tax=Planoprotostelium fungivorum TaxID=1890364 RepID=A0A2P6MW77_9EUKA|nr:hypothetical protein PROFUN_01665 [Planoprotostelium fungivorum]